MKKIALFFPSFEVGGVEKSDDCACKSIEKFAI